jgi:ABC-2 type transport system ATP-binding protein
MRARLALAQTLLPQPELLILDEPSDGLDPEGIHEMRQTILRLHREMGLTILLSSHFLNEVEQLCSRIAVLSKGKKVFEGSLAETRRCERRVRLQTRDFSRATRELTAAGLIREAAPEPGLLVLQDGVETHQVARFLVERGFPLDGLAPEERTLEDFYLSLMETERGGAPPARPAN